MTKRAHAPEFKREAVRIARQPGMSLPRAAKELGVHVNTLRGWTRQFDSGSWQDKPGADLKSEQAKELERLRRENAFAQDGSRHPKKGRGVLREGIQVRYAFVARHRPIWPVSRMPAAGGAAIRIP
jgi:putative transposase